MRAVDVSRAHARLTWPAVALLAFAAICTACSNDNNPSTPTTPTTPTGTVTETLNGIMAPNGTATRTFTARQAGTVTVQLARVDPSATVGLGIGIRGATGADCKFTQTVNTQAGTTAQLTASVDLGTYCAGAYDIGNVGQGGATVTVTVTHP
jgi:hypothetical protein